MNKLNKVIATCLIAFVYPIVTYAQESTVLHTLWNKIEKQYPGVAAKDAIIKSSKYQAKATHSKALPQGKVQLQNSYGTFEGSNGAFFPQTGFFNVSGNVQSLSGSDITANTFGSSTIEWDLYTFGRQTFENKASDAHTAQTVMEKDLYLLKLKQELAIRYINLLHSHTRMEWATKNSIRLADIKAVSISLSTAGLRPIADTLLSSSAYIQSLADQDQWYGKKQSDFIHLAELYGSDSIDYAASIPKFIIASPPAWSPQVSVMEHPALSVLERKIEHLEWSGEAIHRSGFPVVKIMGGYAYRGSGINSQGHASSKWQEGFSNTTNNYLIGIGMTWNVSSIFTNRLKKESFEQLSLSSKYSLREYTNKLNADLSAYTQELNQQALQLHKNQLSVQQAVSAYEMYTARYKSGLLSLSELLQIRQLLEQTELKQIEASKAYWDLWVKEASLTTDFKTLFDTI